MKTLSARTAAIRMAILIVSVGAFDAAAVALSDHPLLWARWIPGLIPLLSPLILWPIIRESVNTAK